MKEIEKNVGRKERIHWGPREIDLDLLFFNDLIYSGSQLEIPHKEILKRDFVLVPLKEIAGDFIHPVNGEKIKDIDISGIEKNIIRRLKENLK